LFGVLCYFGYLVFVVMSGNYSFVIVGKDDNPLYELDIGFSKKESTPHMFILHSSLDIVEELVWKNTALYLKV
jgi:trafficking protein particle complex subunit 2